MHSFFVFYNNVQKTIQFLSHFLLFPGMVPSHTNNKIACRHLEEPESPYAVYFQVYKVEFSFHTFLFLPHSLEEWINFHWWMFSKGHYIFKYDQNHPLKHESFCVSWQNVINFYNLPCLWIHESTLLNYRKSK